jgi:hypothetical protein
MPTLGLYISPEAFLMGVFRGTSSLLRRSIGAVFSTAGHFAASYRCDQIGSMMSIFKSDKLLLNRLE